MAGCGSEPAARCSGSAGSAPRTPCGLPRRTTSRKPSSISAVNVSGAKASTTYTLTSAAGGKVTLDDGAGNSQQITLDATIGAEAEAQGHHPDLELAWGRVAVTLWTHKIDGLAEADFILAARIDRLHAARA